MKRLITSILILAIILSCNIAKAQTGVQIYKKDGSVVCISSEDLNHIDILGEDDELPKDMTEDDIPNSIIISNNIKDLKDGDFLKATAFVTAKCLEGLILTDEGGSIFYYNPEIDLELYPDNTVVEVEGFIKEYARGLQLTQDAKIKAIGEKKYSYPTPKELTCQMIDAVYEAPGIIETKLITLIAETHVNEDLFLMEFENAFNWGNLLWPMDKGNLSDGFVYKVKGYPINLKDLLFNIIPIEVEIVWRYNTRSEENIQFATEKFYERINKFDFENYEVGYLIGYNDYCACPLPWKMSRGFFNSKFISKFEEDNLVFNETRIDLSTRYCFRFESNVNIDDNNYQTPAGKVLMKDFYNRYVYVNPTTGNFETSEIPKITANTIDESFLYSINPNEEDTYIIKNYASQNNPFLICYSLVNQRFEPKQPLEIDDKTKPYLNIYGWKKNYNFELK